MAVIFDLDMTIVDSALVEPLRRAGRWPEVYRLIPQIRPYQGMGSLLLELRQKGIGTAIVTSSPRTYCEKVMEHWGLVADVTVCYHDTKLHKPDPQPITMALSMLGINDHTAVSIGDTDTDIVAAKAAGIIAVGALWGTENAEKLISAGPHHSFALIPELNTFLLQHFSVS